MMDHPCPLYTCKQSLLTQALIHYVRSTEREPPRRLPKVDSEGGDWVFPGNVLQPKPAPAVEEAWWDRRQDRSTQVVPRSARNSVHRRSPRPARSSLGALRTPREPLLPLPGAGASPSSCPPVHRGRVGSLLPWRSVRARRPSPLDKETQSTIRLIWTSFSRGVHSQLARARLKTGSPHAAMRTYPAGEKK